MAPRTTSRSSTGTGSPARILVVEDNPASLLLATAVLSRDGHTVDGASSAEEAREMIARHRPDLILMDINLPGTDGLEFTRELKANPKTAGVVVIALTAQPMPIFERVARAAGCSDYIRKPASPAVLAAAVRDHLAEAGVGEE